MAGVKALPPVGLTVFSVGDGAGVVVLVVVVVVELGVWLLELPQPVASAPTAIKATAAAETRWRITVVELIEVLSRWGGRSYWARWRWTPGGSVGAAGAMTCGPNELPPPGVRPFSVGATVAGLVAVVGAVVVAVVVVVELGAGCSFSLLPQAAVSAAMAIRPAPPAIVAHRRRPKVSAGNRVSRIVVTCRGCTTTILGHAAQ
jgi:hypothetical protein